MYNDPETREKTPGTLYLLFLYQSMKQTTTAGIRVTFTTSPWEIHIECTEQSKKKGQKDASKGSSSAIVTKGERSSRGSKTAKISNDPKLSPDTKPRSI